MGRKASKTDTYLGLSHNELVAGSTRQLAWTPKHRSAMLKFARNNLMTWNPSMDALQQLLAAFGFLGIGGKEGEKVEGALATRTRNAMIHMLKKVYAWPSGPVLFATDQHGVSRAWYPKAMYLSPSNVAIPMPGTFINLNDYLISGLGDPGMHLQQHSARIQLPMLSLPQPTNKSFSQPTYCPAVVATGPRKGNVCGRLSNTLAAPFCGLHLLKAMATAALPKPLNPPQIRPEGSSFPTRKPKTSNGDRKAAAGTTTHPEPSHKHSTEHTAKADIQNLKNTAERTEKAATRSVEQTSRVLEDTLRMRLRIEVLLEQLKQQSNSSAESAMKLGRIEKRLAVMEEAFATLPASMEKQDRLNQNMGGLVKMLVEMIHKGQTKPFTSSGKDYRWREKGAHSEAEGLI